MSSDAALLEEIGQDYKYGFNDGEEKYIYKSSKGLTREIVETISKQKNEPQWMLDRRLEALEIFNSKPMPEWGSDLSEIDFGDIHYYMKANEGVEKNWDDVP